MGGIGETAIVEKDRPELGAADAVLEPTVGLVCTSDCHTVTVLSANGRISRSDTRL